MSSEPLSICVYCGASDGSDPTYREAAAALGADIARRGHRLVYGGGNVGLMGAVSRAVVAGGGRVTGIIPHFLVTKEKLSEALDEVVFVEDMHQRKMEMFSRSDAFVALPGGIGTLEELVEQMTWAQLGRHGKPIVLANVSGFWEPFQTLIDHMRSAGFVRQGLEVKTTTVGAVADILPVIEEIIRKTGKPMPTPDWSPSQM